MRQAERVAGVAAVAASVVYLFQPVIVGVNGRDEVGPLPSEVRGLWWVGAVEAVVLAGVGVALLVLVVAVGEVVRDVVGGLSAVQRAAQLLGVVGASGWLFAGATSLAGYSTVAAAIADTAADQAAQRAAVHVVWVVLTAGVELASIGLPAWLLLVSTVGRRAGVVGRPLAVAGLVIAVVIVGTSLVAFPAGLLLLIPYLLGLGIRLLRRARAGTGRAVQPSVR
jgi:hypothetical protein